ncbi:MAG: 2-hydroxyacyl-CoA dehydratase family protein [Treponema sp.]|jgi:benzoyl-CoA reductase/2-hydroxyglutaryl-CoA dehydratase subunit BcrC/BadD/HgdB|nr:2-hydroxyacyl-CoA dehydratase family protein [Treponema sp.]
MSVQQILDRFHTVASNPAKQKDAYLAAGKKVVLVAPIYTPEEIIHSMGLIPMGAWGGDIQIQKSKEYFPAFICSIIQSILEMGMRGTYKGASALVVPSLCDSLKCLGQNWKYAVTSIPFIPMTYPQNRRCGSAHDFIKAGYNRVISDLETAAGVRFDESALKQSNAVYNEHNAVMRRLDSELAGHPEVTAASRSDIFKSAWFMEKGEHTALVQELLQALENGKTGKPDNIPVMTTGILCDNPSLLSIFDKLKFHIVADDIAAESRQYRTDINMEGAPLDELADKFARMDNCSVLYDPDKKRAGLITSTARSRDAKGVVVVLTKFCDPEEFDYVIIKKACEAEGLPVLLIEVDRQMVDYAQAKTALETFKEVLTAR